MPAVLPASEQELNNLLEVQLSSLVLDWSKMVDEKQVTIDKLEQKLIASNKQIEKLSDYITHWRSVEAENRYQTHYRPQRQLPIQQEHYDTQYNVKQPPPTITFSSREAAETPTATTVTNTTLTET